ncbi:MAG: SCO family protein [Acidobacteria bacterium]|nr:SCO family protein [Acidobacteriota bacterium]
MSWFCRSVWAVLLVFAAEAATMAAGRHPASGLVLSVNSEGKTMVVSIKAIPGYMEAMAMPFEVRNAKQLEGINPGTMIDFVVVLDTMTSYAEDIRVHLYQGLEPDPLTTRRLKLLSRITTPSSAQPVKMGDLVPNFKLVDQELRKVTLAEFRGKVVTLNFVYTRCTLPNFCFRSSNNFGNLQRRFADRLGRDLVLLTVTFDPLHDQPEVLARYASTWKADPATWHFLTGPADDVRRVCDLFGEDSFQDEGLMNHSLRTAIIDRHGRLAANLEGNEFTAQQLGDLVESTLVNNR